MKRTKVAEGDIVLVPTSAGEYGVTKVIYSSRIFRNLILLGIYKAVLSKVQAPTNLPDTFLLPCIYTGSQRIKAGEWPIVGRDDVTAEEREFSRRIVGGHVWLGDECVRDATIKDKETLPTMDAWHCSVVVDRIQQAVLAAQERS